MDPSSNADRVRDFFKRGIGGRALAAGAAAFLLLGMAFCDAAFAQQMRDITISTPSEAMASSSWKIADQMGLFEKHGIRPKFIRMDNASLSTAAVVAGSADFTLAGISDLIVAQAGGQKLVTVANLYGKFGNFVVISKAEADKRGLTSESPLLERIKALDGLLVAGTSATSAVTVALKATVKAAGGNARFTYMTQDNMAPSLESGAIQAYSAATPSWAYPVLKGTALLWLSGPRGDFPSELSPGTVSIAVARREFADANPDLIKTITAVMAEFSEAIDKDRASVRAAVVKLYPNVDARIIDLYFENEAAGWQSTPLTAKQMAREIDVVKNQGVLPPERLSGLDPAAMVYP